MIDPATLRAAQVTALKEIPSLVTLLGAEANIVDYEEEDNGDLFNTVFALDPPKLLVVYQGTNPSGGARSMWQHNFSWIIRVSTSPTAVFAAIVNGVRTGGSGLALLYDSINPNYQPMSLPSMRRAVIPISERASRDYWEITTSFISRGVE
jgi:hypothetical protein